MTIGQKLRALRHLEGHLRGLGREMTQSEVARAIDAELGDRISQSYLSLIENDSRPHLSSHSRGLLARFFKVHPGYLVSDPPGYRTELSPEVGGIENSVDRWLFDGAARFAGDQALSAALERVAGADDSRGCLLLLGELLAVPGLIDQLSKTLMAKERP